MKFQMTFILFCICTPLFAQNIGIDVPDPSEKLEVNGTIFTNAGGIKFPDSTLQTTAAFNSSVSQAAGPRQYILMELLINGNYVPGPDSAINVDEGIRVIDFEFEHSRNSGNPFLNFCRLTKEVDKASIPILQAFHQANSGEVTLHFLLVNAMNQLEEYYQIKMINAQISGVNQKIDYTGDGWSHLETLDLLYERITFEHFPSGQAYNYIFSTP